MFYKTQIKNIQGRYAFDVNGKRLSFIGDYPCKAGDTVWTDGKIIFGNITSVGQTPLHIEEKSGIPVLSAGLRGYFDKNLKFKKYPVANGVGGYGAWLANTNDKVYYGHGVAADIEVSDKNDLYTAEVSVFESFSIYKSGSLFIQKKLEDFKDPEADPASEYYLGDQLSCQFLKLYIDTDSDNVDSGNIDSDDVKWCAVIFSEFKKTKNVPCPDGKKIRLVQHIEQTHELSFTDAAEWKCTLDIVETSEPYADIILTDYHKKQFIVNSDGDEKVIYHQVTEEPVFLTKHASDKLEKIQVNETAMSITTSPHLPGYLEGIVTARWAGLGILEYTYSGDVYKVATETIDVNVGRGTDTKVTDSFKSFTYPVQDDFYISADDINSPLKLFEGSDLILDFEKSGDDFLAGLKGFHSFAATSPKKKSKDKSKNKYLLAIPHTSLWEDFSYVWEIADGKATRLDYDCCNFRLRFMKNIKKAKK